MMVLVTGGASSGKSAFAEALAVACGGRFVYLATMRPFGEEGSRRIARHRAQRAGKGFETVECYGNLESAVASGEFDGATVLLEDLGNLVANELFGADAQPGDRDALDGIAELSRVAANLVVVGNEVGCDGVSYGNETTRYQEEIGRLACGVAAMSDAAFECVAGIPAAIKATGAGTPAVEFAHAYAPEAPVRPS